ncbi:unnamed protein product [Trifolium pratense]|uniref:Uncharacterized protein n=1 Tax=Trifolium pratense TaxID=57577 RepID=A0ACB0LD14_TRIPR|nr:unnamed protein product [Trifolium pratense]
MEIPWNSDTLKIVYTVFGWVAFVVWSSSFYPQFFLNFSRKSVVGLNFNYLLLNNTKHTLYLIYNASLYFSPTIQFQYHQKYGFDQRFLLVDRTAEGTGSRSNRSDRPVRSDDIYERYLFRYSGTKMDWIKRGQICFFKVNSSNLQLIKLFSIHPCTLTSKVVFISYQIPSKAFMNFMIKSTDGFSIGNVFLDFLGGLANYAQMVTQSIDQNSWVNFSGNLGKVLLSLVCMFFDLLFMFQHYVLYPSKKTSSDPPSILDDKITEPLIKSQNQPEATNFPAVENV